METTHMFFDSEGNFVAEIWDYTTMTKLTYLKVKGTPGRRVTFKVLKGAIQ
jgi:hypothetical protein